ncbi:leucyl aminopeptidase [Herbiconiux sp. L3-i23]|uniref:leucyl aminopeptidase n=1 Tax=Herbiconiux sp. L3-i23 TaxID=2905871 RepID=UPI00204B4713|nr:leucyl aminopeptidase [Herbiconiux sp. L3-i23]BDI22894.1 putative cytosol aminopeptidase [Herbiconiux sp. L3-i23]
MPLPALSFSVSPATEIVADVLAIGVRSVDDSPVLHAIDGVESFAAVLEPIGVTGKVDQVVRVPAPAGVAAKSIAFIGLGSGEVTPDSLRYAAGSLTRQLRGATSVAIALPVDDEDAALAALEGAAIGAYAFLDYRVDSLDAAQQPVDDITVLTDQGSDELVARATATATAMLTVRDLVNTPPNDLYPASFAARAEELAQGLPVEITVWDEERLAADGFGGILGVGQGSVRPPRLVKVVWSPADATRHIALVGKGITFDSGGLSLKPAASMIGMKYDMTGAATVLSVALAAARLELPIKVTAWLCLAENMPSGSANRPNDVLRIRGGKTVENLNSDAEGRLVLADGLVAASEEEPDAIIDVATLTGAATVALGTRYVGAMGDEKLVRETLDAAKTAGEPLWHMPLPGELRALLNSDIADIANVKPGNTAGGMLLAGVFLREFVGKAASGSPIPWAHLDIAGAANNSGAFFGFTGKGPTGVSVRTLIALVEQHSKASAVAAK